METMLEIISGFTFVTVCITSVLFGPLCLSLVPLDKLCRWVTDGDCGLPGKYLVDSMWRWLDRKHIAFEVKIASALITSFAVVLVAAAMLDLGKSIHDIILDFYTAGTHLGSTLGILLMTVGSLFTLKFVYGVGKKGKRLKEALDEHIKDKDAHKL